MPSSPLRVAVVCSSNQNRSMEAHNILRPTLQCAQTRRKRMPLAIKLEESLAGSKGWESPSSIEN